MGARVTPGSIVDTPLVEGAPALPATDLAAAAVAVAPERSLAGRMGLYFELTKPRIVLLVVITTLLGFHLGTPGSLARMACALVGTALIAGGANAWNMCLEREQDGLMHRTRLRPLPTGRLAPNGALAFGIATAAAGVVWLAATTNVLTAALGAFAVVTYDLVYTPLKRRTHFAVFVGAVPGAIPPVMGWTAARGTLDAPAGLLFAILFLWQIPHFLALAWIFRDDYARGGYPMLPVVDPSGRRAGRHAVVACAMLLAVSASPIVLGLAGRFYLAGALLLGIAFLAVTIRFARRTRDREARVLFLASIIHLPLLLGLLAFAGGR